MAAAKRTLVLDAVSVSKGLGGLWARGTVVVRWQPWAAPEGRWVAEWVDLLGGTHLIYGYDRGNLALKVPFAFTLRKPVAR